MDWHDFFRNDKTLLAIMILVFLGVWCFIRNDKLFDLMTTFTGALIALITGAVLRGRNGNGNSQQPPKEQ